MKVGKLVGSRRHDVETLLREAQAHESHAVDAHTALLERVEGKDAALEEYARSQIAAETEDLKKIEKMLRQPGS